MVKVLKAIASIGLLLSLSWGIGALISAASPPSSIPPLAGRLDRQTKIIAELTARLNSAERHIAESIRVSHERRASLAGELRREAASRLAGLRQQIDGLKSAVAELLDAKGRLFSYANTLDNRIDMRSEEIVALYRRVKQIEARKPEVVRTETVHEVKVVERPVQPVYLLPQPPPDPTPCRLFPILPRRCR